jgi:hypothetical protein
LNDASKMTPKQRQLAASQAAGLVSSPSGLIHGNERKNQYMLPASVYKAAVQGTYSGSWQDSVRYQKKSASSSRNLPYGTPIPNSGTPNKSAQTKFMASEKKKSSKSVAKNVKRRER